ncbi:MAG: hypothetical protein ACTSUP_03545 [Candidatus Heimdallarchaeaceae archaeon]
MKQNEIKKLLDHELRKIYEDLEEITLTLTLRLSSYKEYKDPFKLLSFSAGFLESNLRRSNKLR